jgi:hypothetical protein
MDCWSNLAKNSKHQKRQLIKPITFNYIKISILLLINCSSIACIAYYMYTLHLRASFFVKILFIIYLEISPEIAIA